MQFGQISKFLRVNREKTPLCDWFWIASAIVILALILSHSAEAQVATGDILGNVQDQTGSVMPKLSVSLLNIDTGQKQTTVTTESGDYTFTLLSPGHYTLTIAAPGFKKFVAGPITLSVGDRARIEAHLQLGAASETVEVASVAPALQADSASLGSVITPEAVQDLPLNGRNFVQLAQLAPGANEGPQDSIASGQRPDDRRQNGSISVNGQPDLANNNLIDGIDNNDALLGVMGARPSIDAIAEFRVVTSLYPAEMGRTGGGVVNLITKSGTTQFHGGVFEFLRNDKLDGRDWFTKTGVSPKPEYRQNQFGGSLGGPLFARTFFFGDYEGLRIVQGQTQTSTVPTLFEEQNPGNFTDRGIPTPLTHLDPIGLEYFKLFPAPTLPGPVANNFIWSPNKTQNGNTIDARGDHTTAKGDAIFARYTYNNVATYTPAALPDVTEDGIDINPGGNVFGFYGPATNIAHNVVIGYTHLFTSHLVGDFRIGYNRIYNTSQIPNVGKNVSAAFGLEGVNGPGLPGLTAVSPGNYANLGDSAFVPIVDTSNAIPLYGTISYIKGGHSLKAGASYIRRGGRIQQNPFGLGWDIFSAAPIGTNTVGDGAYTMLSGSNPVVVQRRNQVDVPNYRTTEISEFAQDDWHVNKILTLNLGVRYDIFTPLTETANHMSLFDPTTVSILLPGTSGVNRYANIQTDYSNFGPRVGFEISATPKTIVRGGFGMTFFPVATRENGYQNNPYNYSYAPFNFAVALDTPFPQITASSTATADLSGGLNSVQKNLRSGYIEQLTLNVQQQIGAYVFTVGYAGDLGRELGTGTQLDAAPLTNSPNYVSMEPYHSVLPNVNGISEETSNGTSAYNAMQLVAERRTNRGFTLNANYTYARNIGNVTAYSDNTLPGGQGTGIVPALQNKMDWGNSDLDVRHRIAAQIDYALPFAKESQGLVGAVAKGWQVNAIDSWQTGTAFTVVDSTGQAYPGDPTDRPNEIGNPSSGSCVKSINCWYNIGAFAEQEFGTIGVLKTDNVGVLNGTVGPNAEHRNQLYGPHYRRFDFSIFKAWQLREKYTLQFRAETYNLSNTPNFGQPNNTISAWNSDGSANVAGAESQGTATISNTRLGSNPRQIQFALKLSF